MHADEINMAFEEKVRRGMFAPVARHVANHPDPEDRLQDALCQVWLMYRDRIIERDLVLDDPILVHACRQRAVDLARHFVPSGGTRRYWDAMDQRAYRDRKVEVFRLDAWVEDDSEDENKPEQIGLAVEECGSPEHKLNSALDLESWIDGLTARDASIMEGRMAGFTLEQIGHDLGMSTSVVCKKARVLGSELASRAGVKIAERKRSSSR